LYIFGVRLNDSYHNFWTRQDKNFYPFERKGFYSLSFEKINLISKPRKSCIYYLNLRNNLIKTSLFIIAWASTIISLIIISKILFSEIKTVYRFIVKTNFFTVIILFLIIPLFYFLNIAQNITIPLSLTSIYIGIVLYYFYTKHFTIDNILKTNKIATQKIHKTHR